MPRPERCAVLLLLFGFAQIVYSPSIRAQQPSEYRLKAAFLYNFAIYTEWPERRGVSFNLCIVGDDPFGEHVEPLLVKKVNGMNITVQHKRGASDLDNCQIVFISRSAILDLGKIIEALKGKPVLTVTDSPEASQGGAAINMTVTDGKIKFDVNMATARNAGLNFSSQLLRFANEVYK